MTPMSVMTGVFLAILFGPLVGYWVARAVEHFTDWQIIPEFGWDEN